MHKQSSLPAKSSRMPLYQQVAALMRQKIQHREWLVGEQIPTLDELEREYQVSRITLRASLDQLASEGIVKRTRGLGTFVARDLSDERWFRLAGSFDELVASVADLKIELLQIDQQDVTLTPTFEFGEPAPAYHRMRRVHYHKEAPYCLIEIYLEKGIYEKAAVAFDSAPVIPTLAAMKGVKLTAGKQIMRVTISDEETAGYLRIGIGDPIADVVRTLLDKKGCIVYYAHIQYPAQMIQVETDLFAGAPRI